MTTAPSGQTRTATLSSPPPLDTVLLIGCAIAVTIPLTMAPWASNAFELPKVTLLRALVLVLAALAVTRLLADRRLAAIEARLWLRHPLVVTVLVFALVVFLSTLGSTNPRLSVWGSYERQQGLLTLLAYLALFFITAVGLRTRPHVDLLWRALVWASAPVVLYGLLQALRLDPLGWQSDAASPVLSTVGRSNFLGSYLVLIIPLTWGQLLVTRARTGLLLLCIGQLTCLALSHARAAWLGMALAGVAFVLVWTWTTGRRRLAWLILAGCLLAMLLIVALGTVWLAPEALSQALIVRPTLPHLTQAVNLDAGSIRARLTIWQAALPLLHARPWLGYGPETLRTAFVAVYPPQLVYYQGRQAVVDRAHNLWLDLGLSSGLAGVFAFGAVLLAFFWLAWRSLRTATNHWTRALWTVLLAAVIGHLVDLHVSFEVTTTATVFWLLLAVAAALTRPGGLTDAGPSRTIVERRPVVRAATLLTLGLALLLWLPLGAGPLLADAAHWQSQQPGQPLDVRLAAAAQAVRFKPDEPVYRLNLAARLMEQRAWPTAAAEVERAVALDPADPAPWAALGDLQARWGEQTAGHRAAAVAAYRQAVTLAPTVAAYHTALGLVLVQDGQLAAGTQELRRAVDLDATDGVAYTYLGDARLAQEQVADAKWAYERAIYWEPTLARAYAGLAHCYAQLGDTATAAAMRARAQQLAAEKR